MSNTASTAERKALAESAAVELASASTNDVLAWALATFGDKLVVAANMQDAVLIDLVSKLKADVDVVFLDTGYHFAETIGTRDAVHTTYPQLRIINATPEQTVPEQDSEYGPRLYERDPTQCCHLRKVVPLRRTLANYACWVTGVRRVDAPTRADTPIVTWDERHGLVKVNPIAAWDDEQFHDYMRTHGVLENPLVPAGYPSIGCAPCTAKVAPGDDPRSGRWAGTSKTECGLHG